MSSQGAQAKTKESQAAVKALEALLSAYNANLVPLEETETTAEHSAASTAEEEGHYLHLKTGHKGVVEIATASSSCHLPCLVHRINVVEAVEGQALADIAHAVVQAALKVKGGCIGWLTAPNPSADAPRRESVNTAMGSAAASSASSAVACGSEEDKLDADLKALAVVPKAQDVLAQQLQQLEGDRLKALSNKAAKVSLY